MESSGDDDTVTRLLGNMDQRCTHQQKAIWIKGSTDFLSAHFAELRLSWGKESTIYVPPSGILTTWMRMGILSYDKYMTSYDVICRNTVSYDST
jgi:hypothetical protein